MLAIILAAGMGTRLGSLTELRPKGMVEFRGKPLLQWQIDALRKGGVDEIVIVTGYKGDCVNFSGTTVIVNEKYAETNMVESLMCARKYFTQDLIISYADIIYEPEFISAMCQNKDDISVAGDRYWRRYWELRFGSSEEDIESFTTNSAGEITDLGAPVEDSSNITHRYIGLLKFSAAGAKKLLDVYDAKAENSSNWSQSGKDFKNGYMTDLLFECSTSGSVVKLIETINGWMEFDEPEDLKLGETLSNNNILCTLGAFSEDQKLNDSKLMKSELNYSFSSFDAVKMDNYLDKLKEHSASYSEVFKTEEINLLDYISKHISSCKMNPEKLFGTDLQDIQQVLLCILSELSRGNINENDTELLIRIQKKFEVKKHLYSVGDKMDLSCGYGGFMKPELYAVFSLCMLTYYVHTKNTNYLNSALKSNDLILNYYESCKALQYSPSCISSKNFMSLSLSIQYYILYHLIKELG